MREDFPIRARIKLQARFVFREIQPQVSAQHVPHQQSGADAVRRPMIVDQRDMVRFRAGIDGTEAERPTTRTPERPVQLQRQMRRQTLVRGLVAHNHFDLRQVDRVVNFVAIPNAVGIDFGDAQAVVLERVSNRLPQGKQTQRPGQPVGVNGVVGVQLAPLQHHPLKCVQSTKWTRCATDHSCVFLGKSGSLSPNCHVPPAADSWLFSAFSGGDFTLPFNSEQLWCRKPEERICAAYAG